MIDKTISHYKILEKLRQKDGGQVGEGGMPSIIKNYKKLVPQSGSSLIQNYNKLIPHTGGVVFTP